jgi:DNA-binding XRE family transcriptional regulator
MTTSKAASGNASLPIGLLSSPQSTERPSGQVFYGEFSPPRALPLPNTKSLSDVLARFQSNPAIAERMPEARRKLGGVLYAKGPATLASLRLRAGLSQAQLAEKINSSQPHIARIERGQTDPGTDTVARIAEALGVEAAAVFKAVQVQRRAVDGEA